MRYVAGCRSNIGRVRENNQDAVALRTFEKKGNNFIVLAVCDGVGGLEHGEMASSLAVARIEAWFDEITEWLDLAEADGELLFSHMKDLVEECNTLVRECRVARGMEMGTTLSLLMIVRDIYYIIQVGDSRVYRYNRGLLEQLTVDASVTRIKNGRMKTYLDNYLGKQEELWFTSTVGRVTQRDLFVVCSDGFYHQLLPEDLREYERKLRKVKKVDEACEELIERMMDRGEKDNITVGIVAVNG